MITDTSTLSKSKNSFNRFSIPDKNGRFGPYGGSFVPETLSHPLRELTEAYEEAKIDPNFNKELSSMLRSFAGRPTELYYAEKIKPKAWGCKNLFKERRPSSHWSSQDQ